MIRALVCSALLLAAGCMGDSEGIFANFWVAQQSMPTEVGTNVTLTSGHFAVTGLTLVPCASVARTLWRAVNPLPSAFAHSESSPLHLGVPVVIGLVGERGAEAVGHILPPPDDYCGVDLDIGPADADAVALPNAEMVGQSALVKGTEGSTPFAIETDVQDDIGVELPRFTLDGTHRSVTLTIGVDAGVFDGVEFLVPSAGEDIVARLADTITVTMR